MTCTYCGAWNPEGEHRCQRCGRRVAGTLSDFSLGNTALAAVPAPVRESGARTEPPPSREPVQRPLFVDRAQPKVIPFKTPTQPRQAAAPEQPKSTTRRPPSPDTQRKLDFLPPARPASRKLKTTVEAVIYCDAPAATKAHRVLAATVDLSLIVIAFGAFVLGFHVAGGEFTPNKESMIVFGAAFGLIAIFYGLLWVLANADTPGKHWTRLQLINFEDGFPPDRMQRLLRLGGFCIGLCAAATGILWILVDEESLAWHDHISKTFLTVREQDTNFFRQR